jgi:prevent-host-death family protein
MAVRIVICTDLAYIVCMAHRILNVTEARRDLPGLVKQVSAGGSPVAIGPRGKLAAVLLGAEEYAALRRRARSTPGAPWAHLRLEIVGTGDDLARDLADLRREVTTALDRRMRGRGR